MKITGLTVVVLACLGLSHAIDMSSILNSVLDNAIDKGTPTGGGATGTGTGTAVTPGKDQGFMSQLGGQALDRILPSVKNFVVSATKTFFDKLFENQLNRKYHDDILMHRAVRVYKTGETSVTILDRTSGLKAAATGETLEEAIESATKTLISTLLTTGQMSLLDLGLPEPTKPVTVHCVDNFGLEFCRDMKRRGFCQEGHTMAAFSVDYCRKTCTVC